MCEEEGGCGWWVVMSDEGWAWVRAVCGRVDSRWEGTDHMACGEEKGMGVVSPRRRELQVAAIQPTFVTPPVDINGTTLTFQLLVEDSTHLTDTDTVSITINDNGITGFPNDAITFTSASDNDMGITTAGGSLTSLDTIDPDTIADTSNKPSNLIYGLVDIEISVVNPGDPATVVIFLPEPAPQNYKWYKYSANSGWYDFSDHAEFNDNRDEVTLTLVDGGAGDDDKEDNRTIIDPSGLGYIAPVDGGGGGGVVVVVDVLLQSFHNQSNRQPMKWMALMMTIFNYTIKHTHGEHRNDSKKISFSSRHSLSSDFLSERCSRL